VNENDDLFPTSSARFVQCPITEICELGNLVVIWRFSPVPWSRTFLLRSGTRWPINGGALLIVSRWTSPRGQVERVRPSFGDILILREAPYTSWRSSSNWWLARTIWRPKSFRVSGRCGLSARERFGVWYDPFSGDALLSLL